MFHSRRTIRLQHYNYANPGYYFITICTYQKAHLFGVINNHVMNANSCGLMVQNIWQNIPNHYAGFHIHGFVVMPNHVHGIIEIVPKQDEMTLGELVGRYKSYTTRCYANAMKQPANSNRGIHLWHRNYHEHIIRDEQSYLQLLNYIETNPLRWKEDIYCSS